MEKEEHKRIEKLVREIVDLQEEMARKQQALSEVRVRNLAAGDELRAAEGVMFVEVFPASKVFLRVTSLEGFQGIDAPFLQELVKITHTEVWAKHGQDPWWKKQRDLMRTTTKEREDLEADIECLKRKISTLTTWLEIQELEQEQK